MWGALAWGALAASSLILGVLLGLVRTWPERLVGLVLAFGAGALVAAVAFELAEEGARVGGTASVAVGLATGALTYYLLDTVIGRHSSDQAGEPAARASSGAHLGPALALGTVLDGIPEQAVFGISLVTGSGVNIALLVAVFVSNVPEAIGSAVEMRASGHTVAAIWRLWSAVALVCTSATVAGYALAEVMSGFWNGVIDGFAGGALLVMLIDTMIPAAAEKTGRTAGLATVLGFAIAAGLSASSV